MSKAIRVGYVGTGWIADWHFNAMKRCETVEVVGACEHPDAREKLHSICKQWDIKPYESFEEMLADTSLDAVALFSPTHLHLQQALQALEAGKHLLVEKPIAFEIDQIEQIEKAAEKAGKIVFPSHNFVYRPVVTKAKEIIDSGALGTISYASFRAVHFIPEDASSGWRRFLKFSGGGAMLDSGTHLVYQSLYLVGTPEKISSFKANKHYTAIEAEDVCQISLMYKDGTIGQILQSWAADDEGSGEIRIQGNKGTILISDALYHNGEKIEDDAAYPDSFYHTACAFADAVLNNKAPISSVKDAKRTLDIIQKAYRAAEEDKIVQL